MTSGLTRHRTILAAVNALVLGGCRAGPTTTEDEVADKAQEHIDGILTVLSEDAELDMRESTLFAACDDPTDGAPQGRVTVSETFWVRGLPVEDNDANIDLVLQSRFRFVMIRALLVCGSGTAEPELGGRV